MLVVALSVGLAPGPLVGPGVDRVPRPVLSPEGRLEVTRGISDLAFDPRALKRTGNGGYVYMDPRGRFRAEIAADGAIHVGPGAPVDGVGGGTCILGFCLDGSRVDGGAHDHLDPTPGERAMAVAMDGPGMSAAPLMIGVGFSFGLPLMSTRAAEGFRRATFEMRLQMARSAMKGRIVAALAGLEDELRGLLEDEGLGRSRLRALLFERWDECEELVALPAEEDLRTDLERMRQQAGDRARRRIERFVRTHLPAGSPGAFPREELRRLNTGRHSRARFEPYGRPDLAPAAAGADDRPAG